MVSGLALAGASATPRDLYASVIKKGRADERNEVRVSKIATVAIGIVAIVLENQSLAFMVALTFGIAASLNFSILILAMSWRGLTTKGAL